MASGGWTPKPQKSDEGKPVANGPVISKKARKRAARRAREAETAREAEIASIYSTRKENISNVKTRATSDISKSSADKADVANGPARGKSPEDSLSTDDQSMHRHARTSPYHRPSQGSPEDDPVRRATPVMSRSGRTSDRHSPVISSSAHVALNHYPPLTNMNAGFFQMQYGAVRATPNHRGHTSTTKVHFAEDYLRNVAQQAIEKVASSGDHVTLEQIQAEMERTLAVPLSQVASVRDGRVDSIPVVYELVRVQCKVNAYIQAFVTVRSIATVYELGECLRDYVSDKRDFKELNLGPLVKQPLVYKFFKMPPDADVLPLETSDIYELLRSYLTEHKKWMTRDLSVDELMTYMAEKQNVSTPYELGLRMTSPALMIGVLKKAQRDCGQSMRTTLERLDRDLQAQLSAVFEQFVSGLLSPAGAGAMCSVRRDLFQLDPSRIADQVFTSYVALLRYLGRLSECIPQGRPMAMKPQLCHAAEAFWTELRTDALGQKLFKFALCVAREDAHAQLADVIHVRESEKVGNGEKASVQDKRAVTVPTHDAVFTTVRKYLDRCLANGPLQLNQLELMERRVIDDLKLEHFHEARQGSSLLAFILADDDTRKYLEECGGSMFAMGTAATSTDQLSCCVSVHDILEFVRQCGVTDKSQYPLVEGALCEHYGVRSAKQLGHGSVAHLCEKPAKRVGETVVFYEGALCAKKRSSAVAESRTVGLLGAQTCDTALACLQCCPLLADVGEWSHWRVVFEPQLGDLKTFLLKYGGIRNCHAPGVTTSQPLLALETSPGHLIRVNARSTPESFAAASARAEVDATCGHLVSIVALCGGIEMAPLALLANHVHTALLKSRGASSVTVIDSSLDESDAQVARFLLGCLQTLPLVICEVIANQVFLEPLAQVVGGAKSKSLLLANCATASERGRLQYLGLLLGVATWSDDFAARMQPIDLSSVSSDGNDTEDDDSVRNTVRNVAESIGKKMAESEQEETAEVLEENVPQVMECEVSSESGDSESDDSKSNADNGDVQVIEDDDDTDGDVIFVDEDEDESCSSDTEADIKLESHTPTQSTQHAVVESIRRDEFGVHVALTAQARRLMRVQQERQGRSLSRLADDLYSRDTHFVLELLQNADDNAYPASGDISSHSCVPDVPAVRFIVERDRVTVLNNECGFVEKNIRAVCDVGRSTKGRHTYGYIGQKGIGFKSVFRVTDRPEIHSNGYHICFDVLSSPMGYILPHWIDSEGATGEEDKKWNTRIVLPLKASLQSECRGLAARFHDVHPSLLLFLHRLRSLEIDNRVENLRTCIVRRDLSDGVIEVAHDSVTERWLMVRQTVDTRQVSLQSKSGVQVDSTEIALAFPLLSKDRLASRVLPDKQPVFAFLPLRSYGFRFVIQGDFDLPSSREDVDKDCAWNQWLRASIPQLFINALDSFRSHAHFTAIEATIAFLQFVPSEDEILDFFRPVATAILAQLKARPCLPAHATEGEEINWRMPSQLVLADDPTITKRVITPALLRQRLGLDYLHVDVAAFLSAPLAHAMGVRKLTTTHFIDIGAAMASALDGEKSVEEFTTAVHDVAQWLTCVYRSLDEFADNAEHIDKLRTLPIMPLQDGCVVRLSEATIFFLDENESEALSSENDSRMLALHRDLCTVHSALLTSQGGVANSQVRQLLNLMGVKKLTARDIVRHHVLPLLEATDAMTRPADLLVACVVYVKQQWTAAGGGTTVCSGVDMDRVRRAAVLLTSDGAKRIATTPVHFTPAYRNAINLRTQLPGHAWVLLSDCYLRSERRTDVHGWRQFFTQLGVLDFIAVTSHSVTLTPEQLDTSPWSVYKSLLPECSTYTLTSDFECTQFAELASQAASGSHGRKQVALLLTQLERGWTETYARYATTHIADDAGHTLHTVDTSFGIALKSLAWLPALEPDGAGGLCQTALRGSDVFSRQTAIERLLGAHVSYLDAPMHADTSLRTFLGVRMTSNAEVVCDNLKSWCHRDDPTVPRMMTTSIAHMKAVYRCLHDELPPKQLQDLFHENDAIFIPDSPRDMTTNKSGKFLGRSAVRWADPTGLFDKYANILLGDTTDAAMTHRTTLVGVYPELHDVFVSCARVQPAPSINDLCQLLVRIAATCVLPDALGDSLRLTQLIGVELEANSELEAKVKAALGAAAVIPVKGSRWVSASRHPMIADDRELEAIFRSKPRVCFVELGRPVRGVDSTHARMSQLRMLHALGVRALSECVHVEPITEMSQPCVELASYVRSMLPYLQKMLYTEHRAVYDVHVASDIAVTLVNMRFDQVSKLELVYSLEHDRDVVEVVSERCRMIDRAQLCVQRDHVTAYNDINKELARFFSASDQACCNAIRSYLMDLVPLITTNTAELSSYMSRHRELDKLPPGVESWQVSVPDVPPQWQVAAPHAAMVVDEESVADEQKTSNLPEDGDTGLRSWPPRSSGVPGGGSGRSCAVTTKWPPPAPHMSSHQLPSSRSSSVTRLSRSSEQRHRDDDDGHASSDTEHDYGEGVTRRSNDGHASYGDRKTGDGRRTGDRDSTASHRDSNDGHRTGNHDSSASNHGSDTNDGHRTGDRDSSASHRDTNDGRRAGNNDGGSTSRDSGHRDTGRRTADVDGSTSHNRSDSTRDESPCSIDDNSVTHQQTNHEDSSSRDVHDLTAEDEGSYVEIVNASDGSEFKTPSSVPSKKRLRTESNSSQSSSIGAVRKSASMNFGAPIWLAEPMTNVYEDVPSPCPLLPPAPLEEEDEVDGEFTDAVGRWGEQLVWSLLLGLKAAGELTEVIWQNETANQGTPYDFEVHERDSAQSIYVEVKSTTHADKAYFEISAPELDFARSKCASFHVYRVLHAGMPQKARVMRLRNLAQHIDSKQVRLCIAL